MLRNASIAVCALVLAGAATAQTSKRPGAPIRVILDAPKPADPTVPATPAKSATPAPAAAPAAPAPAAAPAARPAPPSPGRAAARTDKPAAAPARHVDKPKPAAAPKPRDKPKRLPPFPKLEPGKPETYRRAIEAWRDLLEEQRIARGGDRYPSYTQALAKYQRGVDIYFQATGRSRDKAVSGK